MLHVFLVHWIQWLLGYDPPATQIERSNTMQTKRFGGSTGPVVHIFLHDIAQPNTIWGETTPSPAGSAPGACDLTAIPCPATRRLSAARLNLNLRLAVFAGEPQIALT